MAFAEVSDTRILTFVFLYIIDFIRSVSNERLSAMLSLCILSLRKGGEAGKLRHLNNQVPYLTRNTNWEGDMRT